MKQVATHIGVTESLISQIERDKVSPSIDTLMSIVEYLEIDLEYLFQDFRTNKAVRIVKRDDRSTKSMRGVVYHQLSTIADSVDEYEIEAVLLEIEPGAVRGNTQYGHPGKELGVILSGSGELSYGTEEYVLDEGDSVSFSSDIPHSLKNVGKGTLKAIWVNTPPRTLFG